MADKEKGKKLTTGLFRASFPHVFKPQTTPSGEQRFSLVMLMHAKDQKDDIKALKTLAKEAAYAKWGKDSVEGKKVKVQWPWRDGEEKAEQYDGYEGMIFMSASSKNKPKVVRKLKDGTLEVLTDDEDFYPGCYAVASVNAYAWEWKGKKGVSYGLINVLKRKDGERFGFGSKPEDDFADLEGDDTDYGDTEDELGLNDDEDDNDD